LHTGSCWFDVHLAWWLVNHEWHQTSKKVPACISNCIAGLSSVSGIKTWNTSIEPVGWSGGKRDVAPLARRAIKGLATMLTKDSCLHYQSEADAVKVSMHPCKHAATVHFPAPDASDHERARVTTDQAGDCLPAYLASAACLTICTLCLCCWLKLMGHVLEATEKVLHVSFLSCCGVYK